MERIRLMKERKAGKKVEEEMKKKEQAALAHKVEELRAYDGKKKPAKRVAKKPLEDVNEVKRRKTDKDE